MNLKRIAMFCCLAALPLLPACFPLYEDCALSDVSCSPAALFLYLTPSKPSAAGPAQPCGGSGMNLPSFHSYLSSGLNLQGQAVCALKDGGLIAVGETNTGTTLQGLSPLIPHSGSLGDALVIKWDATGNVVWFTYLGTGASSLRFKKMAETNDGGVVLLGYMNGPDNFVIGGLSPILPATSGDDTDIYVVRLRADGSLAWHTALGGGGSGNEYDAGDVVVTNDGGIYLSGTGGSGAPSTMGSVSALVPFTAGDNNNVLAAKLSDAGELLWFRYIGGGGAGASYYGLSLALTGDGNLVIGGNASGSPSNTIAGQTAILPFTAGDTVDALALKIDLEGNLLWFSYLGGNGAGNTYTGGDVTALNDGSVVLVGEAQTAGVATMGGVTALLPYTPGDPSNGLVWKLDAAGSLQWFTYLGGAGGYYAMVDSTRSADGGVIVGGTAQNGTATMGAVNAVVSYQPSVNAVFLAKLTAAGNLEWFTYTSEGAGSTYGLSGLAATREGGLIAVGYAQDGAATLQGKSPLNPYNVGDTYNLFVMKLDAQGRL